MNFEDIDTLKFEESKVTDAVIISFGPFNGLDEIHAVDIKLFDEIPEEIGRHDGHAVNMDDTDGRFFTYGNNAEDLFKAMKPILSEFEFLKNAEVYLEFTENGKVIRDLEFKLNQS